jgi:hypothetical protein
VFTLSSGGERRIINPFDAHLVLVMRSCLPRWIFLLLGLLGLNLSASAADVPEISAWALYLLNYLGADYPATVTAGEVLNARLD